MFSFDFGQVDSLLVVKCVVESGVLLVRLMAELILVYFFILKKNVRIHCTEVMNKLLGWKERFLSFAGWVVLIKLVMFAIPTHIMQGVALPVHVCNKLDRSNRDFYGGPRVKRKGCT